VPTLPRRSSAAVLLIYAISALVPTMWVCPIDWEQLPLHAFVRCSVELEGLAAPCAAARHLRIAPTAENVRACQALQAAGASCPPQSHAPARSKHGRAYRLGDPGGGPSVRANAIALPALFAASLGFIAPALEPPSSVRLAWRPEARARPPNEVWSVTPPVRGPPV
jgi:hypothetical protein